MTAVKHPIRRLLVGLLVLLALIGVAYGALVIAFPPARVRALAQAQLQAALAREVRFADAAIGLWPPVRLTVRGPAIAEPGGFSRGTALQARALDLDLDPFALLARRLVLRRLVLDHPAVHVVLHADGTTNFDGLAAVPGNAPAGKAPPPMDLAVRELRIDGADVLVDDLRAARRTAFRLETRTGFSIAGGERIATEGRTTIFDLARGPLSAARRSDLGRSLAGLRLTLEHRGKFDLARKRLALERLALRMGRAEFGLWGVVDVPGPRARVDLRARGADVDLSQVMSALSAAEWKALHGVSGAGRLDFDLGVSGALAPGASPSLAGLLKVSGGVLRYPGAPVAVEAIAFSARFTPDSMTIGDFGARVAGQPVQARLSVARFADPRLAFAVHGAVDLAAVSPLVAPADTRVGGKATLDLRGGGRARDPEHLALDGHARLEGVRIEARALPKPVESLQGEVAFSATRAAVHGLTAKAGRSSFTLDAEVERPLAVMARKDSVPPAEVTFTLQSPWLDLTELLPATPGPAVLPNARGSGTVAIAHLERGALKAENVRARVSFDPTSFTASEFGLDGYGGTIGGQARFDLQDPARPGFAVKARVDSVEADALLSAWTGAKGLLHGALSTDIDLSGQGTGVEQLKRTLTAVGAASVLKGKLGPALSLQAIAGLAHVPAFRELSFQELKLPFQVERGRVTTRDVVIRGASSEWRATGAIGFDGALDYAVSVTVPKEAVARLGANAALAAGALTDDQGRVLLDLKLGGNARAPRVAWDAAAMRDRVAGRVSRALEEQRSRLETQAREALEAQRLTGGDSVHVTREQAVQALVDTLRKKKGRDILRELFGKPKAPAKDTAARDSAAR